MPATPDIMTLIGLATSISLLAGWRLYLCIFATGLAMRWGVVPAPQHLAALKVLAGPWVLGASGIAALCEFFADKVPWVDSLWDGVHTAIRPLGGAMLALSIVDPADPQMQVVAFILGGSGALLAHTGKAGARAVANLSPEPFSNIALSATEDVVSGGLLALLTTHLWMASGVALALLVLTVALLVIARRALGRISGWARKLRGKPSS